MEPPSNQDTNSWREWSKFILKELERLNHQYEALDEKLNKLHVDLVTLKAKASIWGAIAGLIPGAIFFIIQILNKHSH